MMTDAMIHATRLAVLAPQMRDMDLFFFDGHDFSDVEHLVTDALSNDIYALTGEGKTHVGMLRWINGKLYLVESTILNGKNGPQMNLLADRVLGYPGRAWWTPLDRAFRASLDPVKLWALADSKVGTDRYDVLGLFKKAASMIPLIGKLPPFRAPDRGHEYCSDFVCRLLTAGGTKGLPEFESSPEWLFTRKLYGGILQIVGDSTTPRNFNSVALAA
jgi:hypothetical protein